MLITSESTTVSICLPSFSFPFARSRCIRLLEGSIFLHALLKINKEELNHINIKMNQPEVVLQDERMNFTLNSDMNKETSPFFNGCKYSLLKT